MLVKKPMEIAIHVNGLETHLLVLFQFDLYMG